MIDLSTLGPAKLEAAVGKTFGGMTRVRRIATDAAPFNLLFEARP